MMKIKMTLAATFLAYSIQAQITGKITNKVGEVLPFVNVVLYKAVDTSIISGAFSDENGLFSLKTPSDTYGTSRDNREGGIVVGFSSIGFASIFSKHIFEQNENVDLGTIVLLEETNTLDEMVVREKKNFIQNTPTGKVINVQNSLMTKGSSALQILERLPGVIIDRRNNSLSLNGQNGVSILINGKTVRLSLNEIVAMLNGMTGDNIEKIELITSPTAQYDAEGGAGLINILLKKNENEGTNLNVSSTLGYGYREKGAASFSLTHGRKKANYYASYSFLHDRNKTSWQADAKVDIPAIGGYYKSDYFSTTFEKKQSHNLSMGFDFKPNPKTLWGGNMNYMNANTNPTVENDGIYDFKTANYLRLKSVSTGENQWQNVQSSLFFEHQISPNTKLNMDAGYWDFRNNAPALINTVYLDKMGIEMTPSQSVFTKGNKGESLSKINIGVFKMDFSTKLKEKTQLEFGIKGSLSNNSNNSKVERQENGAWVLDARSQSELLGTEGIAAAYTSFNFTINPKTTLTTGVRYEYWTRTFNTNNEQKQNAQFFPTLHFNYKISDNNQVNFNATRRISRPAYNDLLSNLFYNDPSSVFTGNPLLKPTITNTLKAEFIHKNLSFGLTFQHEDKPIIRYQLSSSAANDILILSPQNLDYQNSIGINAHIPIDVFKWWKLTFGGSTTYRRYKLLHTPKTVEKSYFFHNYYANQTFSLPKNLEIEITAWRNFSFFDGPNRITGFGVLNFGIAKKLNKERGTIQLSIADVLKSMNIFTDLGVVTPVVFIQQSRVHFKDETAYNRVFKLTYSRSFGSTVNGRNKSKNAEEESERVRQ
jgi:iron complex outermembrane recepter protein